LGPPIWAGGVADPLEIRPCYPAKFGPRSNDTSVIKEIRLKNLTPHIPPFTVTQGHRSRHMDRSATYDFPLAFHLNHGPISYPFRD